MDHQLIIGALEDYFTIHYCESQEPLSLNVWYPIKMFQLGKFPSKEIEYGKNHIRVIPSIQVTSIVVSPKGEY